VGLCPAQGTLLWRLKTSEHAAVGVQACAGQGGPARGAAGRAPVKPAAPPVVAPCRAPHPASGFWPGLLVTGPAGSRSERGFFWVHFRGFCNPSPALIQLRRISSAAQCAAPSRSWCVPGLAVAKGTFVLGFGKPQGLGGREGPVLGTAELPRSCLGADGGDPTRGGDPSPVVATASLFPSVPRPNPAAPPCCSSPFPASPGRCQKPWLGASRLCHTCQSRALLLSCQGSQCGIANADAVTGELLAVPQEQRDLPRDRGGPQHPPDMRGFPCKPPANCSWGKQFR